MTREMAGAALLLLAATAACAGKDDVTFTARLPSAELELVDGTLGAELGGSIELSLKLGEYADQATTVTLEKFSVLGADEATEIIPSLGVTSGDFPLALAPGAQRTVELSIEQSALLTETQVTALCAGHVHVAGAVRDTLTGAVTAVVSPEVAPTGCP